MAQRELSIDRVGRLLADTWTADFNPEDQLEHVAQEDPDKAFAVRMCRLPGIQLGVSFAHEGGSFYHNSEEPHHDQVHTPYNLVLLHAVDTACHSPSLIESKKRLYKKIDPCPFLMLPLEIRLEVYSYCLIGESAWGSAYIIRPQRRDSTRGTTGISNAILRTNKQVHNEAEPILYQIHSYDFEDKIHLGLRFLQSISERARLNIRSISMTLSDTICNLKDWSSACAYIAEYLNLQELTFDCFISKIPTNYQYVDWVQDLIQIRGLQKLVQCSSRPESSLWYMFSSNSALDETLYIIKTKLQALLAYLRSEMLADDAPEPSGGELTWQTFMFDHEHYP